jgi:hypothetical protein
MNIVAKVEIYKNDLVHPIECDDVIVSVDHVKGTSVALRIPSPCGTGSVIAELEFDALAKAVLCSK